MLRIARAGNIYDGLLPGESWTSFKPSHDTYVPVEYATNVNSYDNMSEPVITVLQVHNIVNYKLSNFFCKQILKKITEYRILNFEATGIQCAETIFLTPDFAE